MREIASKKLETLGNTETFHRTVISSAIYLLSFVTNEFDLDIRAPSRQLSDAYGRSRGTRLWHHLFPNLHLC